MKHKKKQMIDYSVTVTVTFISARYDASVDRYILTASKIASSLETRTESASMTKKYSYEFLAYINTRSDI